MLIKSLIVATFICAFQVSSAIAACDDGRVPCSHKCKDSKRPACKDSKGSDGKPYCVTPGFCRDYKNQVNQKNQDNCDPGWTTRKRKCSKKQRKKGCKDAKGKIYGYCIKY